MITIKNFKGINFIHNESSNTLSLCFSEYARFVGKSNSTISKREKPEYIISVKIKNSDYKSVPISMCLQWLLKDKPEKINLFVEAVYEITGQTPSLPDFSSLKYNISKKEIYSPVGYVYIFETEDKILKVGFSKNVRVRLKTLQRWEGELSIVEVFKATIYQEKEIHKILHATGKFLGDEWYPKSRKEEILHLLKSFNKN